MSALKMPDLPWPDWPDSKANQCISIRLGDAGPTVFISGRPPSMGLLIGEEPAEKPAGEEGYSVAVSVRNTGWRNFGLRVMRIEDAKRAAWLLGLHELVKTLHEVGPEEVREDVARIGLTIERELDALKAAWSTGSKAGGSTP